jgi:2,3-bisphosphoglycerate-dependent phosphoglycerate mutase
MVRLVLLRHGQSLWNLEERFTGWKDIDLSPKGLEEARNAGRLLNNCGYVFNIAYTSVLKRAIKTLWIVLEEMDLMWIPVIKSWRLNERNYGALQGLNKRDIENKYGKEQLHKWRRGYRDMPPALKMDDERWPVHDPRYSCLDPGQIPFAESLEQTEERVLSCWQKSIVPDLLRGKAVFVCAHGNSLRALIKLIETKSAEEIETVEIPTGIPLVYELDEGLQPISRFYLKSKADCGS